MRPKKLDRQCNFRYTDLLDPRNARLERAEFIP